MGEPDSTLTIKTRAFSRAIAIDVPGFKPDDDFFHLAPGGVRTIRLTRSSGTRAIRGTVRAVNAAQETRVTVAP